MSGKFRRTSRGFEARFSDAELQVLAGLFTQLVALLEEPADEGVHDPLEDIVGMSGRPVGRPDDPAVARLLPDAYADPEAAAEYRRFTEHDLRAGKVSAARQALTALQAAQKGRVTLDGDGAASWLSALNDARLVLGTRYEVTEETYDRVDRLPDGHPDKAALVVFSWLGWVQETLVHAVAGW